MYGISCIWILNFCGSVASKFRSHFELFSFRQRTVEFVPTIRRLESVGGEQHGWICIHFLFVIWEPTDYSDSSALSTDCNCLISFPFRLCFPISKKTTRREIPSRGKNHSTDDFAFQIWALDFQWHKDDTLKKQNKNKRNWLCCSEIYSYGCSTFWVVLLFVLAGKVIR